MTLDEAVKRLDTVQEDLMLCAREPWSKNSECLLFVPDETFTVPQSLKDIGFVYFLEVSTAREVLGVFGEKPPTDEEKVRLLIHYAENDAYPEWVYKR